MRTTSSAGLALALACAALLASGHSAFALTQAATPPREPVPPERLAVARAMKRQIRTGESHAFLVRLKAGEFADFVVEQAGADVVVTIFDPAGTKLLSVDSPNSIYGPEPAAVIAGSNGDYRFEVSAPDRGGGGCEARLLTVRPATSSDRAWVAAVDGLSKASVLVVSRSGPAALQQAEAALELARSSRGDTAVELGNSEPVDAMVDRLRESLGDPRRKDTRSLSRQLDEVLMEPVRNLCGPRRRLLLSPDGPLTLVPFGALVDERGRFLVESYTMSYLTSGRDLLRAPSRAAQRGQPTILANPSFGDASELATATGTRDIVQAGSLVFSPLPGTLEEATELASILPGALVLTDADATEAAVKNVHGPRVLHIATHGFFLDRDPAEEFEFNPLVRSGLALAGGNARSSGNDDGVLTALEVAGLDLEGTEFVVLSACNTGVGDTRSGQGVSGLRRALVLAGSQRQVISLWPIADRATRHLMVAYYRRLLSGEGRTEALRNVQMQMLSSPRTRHPFYWAGFIQSGAWTALDGIAAPGPAAVR